MSEIWVQLPNNEKILLKVSSITWNLKVIYNGEELCKINSRGGSSVFNIGENKVELEYKTSMLWGTQKIIIKFNGEKIYENKLIMGM
ncbi:hypothetical protein [Methanococcus aeolicus]|uniref:hypothetical protein n=1 Tax=Methanococcus aeolicus TaxID=42879 RepID=UPI00064F6789|nr:hypothetical protein [Methanococcus aeolicus]